LPRHHNDSPTFNGRIDSAGERDGHRLPVCNRLTPDAARLTNLGIPGVSDLVLKNAVNAFGDRLDVDGDGAFSSRDSLLIMRWLSGFRGNALTDGLPDAIGTRQPRDSTQIANFINAGCPAGTSAAQDALAPYGFYDVDRLGNARPIRNDLVGPLNGMVQFVQSHSVNPSGNGTLASAGLT
jgi:hypothetical protein